MTVHLLNRRNLIMSGLGATVAGCVNTGRIGQLPNFSSRAYGFDALKPLDVSAGNLIKITVCTRPFRPAGPRLEAETVGKKTIIHNYGHGGSGWSLAWGYAEAVRDLVAVRRPKSVTVLGAGAMGLTTAIAIAETSTNVTIYARDLPLESRSARATGVWSPSSRVGFKDKVDDAYPALWETLARRSYARHLSYVGRTGNPVEFQPRFYLRSETPEPPLTEPPTNGDKFIHLRRSLRGMEPGGLSLNNAPFPVKTTVTGQLEMTFNITEYTRQLTDEFLSLGGRIERGTVSSMDDIIRLPSEVVVNCTGYDAKMLVGDGSLVPVRGQIAWMAPQTDRRYSISHRNVAVISRSDGLLIQETGGNSYYGFGDDTETPNRDEFLAARAKVAPMFNWG
ncbi:MAG: FAD-dependent oxidoreductase [Pseudomonadota bacterium]